MSDMRYVVGDLVEGRVPVDLVATGREERILLVRAGRRDRVRTHDPDAHALVAPGVEIAGAVQRHVGVGGMQGADVHMVQPPLAPQEDFEQRPLVHECCPSCRSRNIWLSEAAKGCSIGCLCAWAMAASRTHSPSSFALRRWAMRSALHGPSPLMTRLNSAQSGWPKSWAPRASFQRSSGSGSVTPSASACGTVMSTNRWRSSSLVCRLIRQCIDWAVLGESASGGPNIISDGHHHRFVASCTMSRCAAVPRIIAISSS